MKLLRCLLPMLAPVLLTGCLSLPSGLQLSVSPDGCTQDGSYCAGRVANYYDPPTRTVVLAPGQGPGTILHEVCHGHQHQVVLDSLGREPDIALSQWYVTNEGVTFMAATGWQPDGGHGPNGPTFRPNATPWSAGLGFNPLEDAAWTCSRYLTDPETLKAQSPERYAWAVQWLR